MFHAPLTYGSRQAMAALAGDTFTTRVAAIAAKPAITNARVFLVIDTALPVNM
jgi:hypothetical protein